MAKLTKPMAYQTAIYINTTPSGETEKYERFGKGFTGLNKSQNPQVETEQYIDDINATSNITALQSQMAYTGSRVVGDPVNDFIAGLEDKIGSDVVTTIVKVNLWESAGSPANTYTAKLYNVAVAAASTGDLAGGKSQTLSGTIYINGDPVVGKFDTSTKKFTPDVSA